MNDPQASNSEIERVVAESERKVRCVVMIFDIATGNRMDIGMSGEFGSTLQKVEEQIFDSKNSYVRLIPKLPAIPEQVVIINKSKVSMWTVQGIPEKQAIIPAQIGIIGPDGHPARH